MKTMSAMLMCSVLLCAGCTTSKDSRDLAADVTERLAKYREGRDKAIESLNASYRTSYLSLMSQYRTINDAALAVGRRVDARTAADDMLVDWVRRSTWTSVAALLEGARTRQLDAMARRAAAIADARRRYAESYAALSLELDKLKGAEQRTAELSQDETSRNTTLRLLSELAKAYAESQGASNPATP